MPRAPMQPGARTSDFTTGPPERKRYENPGGDIMEAGDARGQ